MECLFCKIANGKIPSKKIYEDNLVIAFLDINPDSAGHTLIIPKNHYIDLNDIDENILLQIMRVSKMLKIKLETKLKCDGMMIRQNNGDLQEIKHYHLHLKPYYSIKKDITLEEVYELLK